MEPQIFDNQLSTPPQPPQNYFFSPPYPPLAAASNRQIPPIENSDQSIESAFSRLNLTSDFRFRPNSAAEGGGGGGAAPSPRSVPPMAFRGSHLQNPQQALNWAQSGPFGAHQNPNVGPDFSPVGPYAHAGGHSRNQLINSYQRLDFYDDFDLEYHNVLHGKEPLKRYNSNVVPFANSVYSLEAQRVALEDLMGKIVSLAKDRFWSSVLIMKLEGGLGGNEIEMIVFEVMECWDELLRNQFGSQFLQKLFAVCNEDQRTRIIMAVTRFPFVLTSICLSPAGAKAVQKLLEKLNTPQQISMVVAALIPSSFVLATDGNGQHIIHFCVKRFPGEYVKHLLNEIADNFFRIATNKSGCCVIQSCVENSCGETRERLIREIRENAVQLAEDPYGNYVVQHLLGMKMQKVTKDLLRRFQGCFVSLSCNKYASNVVEKLLQSGDEVSTTIIVELLRSPNASMMLVDPFGNFVIQNALSAAKGKCYDALVKLIQANASSMQSNLYGKKILAWFDKKKTYNG